MGDTETASSPSSSSLSNPTSAEPLSRRAPRHWLEYAAVALAGLAFIASSFAAGFSGWQAWILSDTAERQLRAYVYVSFNTDLQKISTGLGLLQLRLLQTCLA
jgi:hypothetical protein